MRKDSPEDRLLNLIKGKYKKKSTTKPQAPGDKETPFGGVTKEFLLKSKVFKPSFLKSFNTILTAILIIAAVYFINSFLFSRYRNIESIIKGISLSSIDEDIGLPEGSAPSHAESYEVYSGDIKGKKLFGAPILKESKETSPSTVDIAKRFSLVGIIAGEEPQAIIEDKETQKTHYLYSGQSFNGAVVRKIGEGKVTLSYNGMEIILVL